MKTFFLKLLKKTTKTRRVTATEEAFIDKYYQELNLKNDLNFTHTDFDATGVFNRVGQTIENPVRTKKLATNKWAVAASVAMLCGLSAFAWQYRFQIMDYASPIQTKEIAALNGEVKQILLADGTKIWINTGSKLIYPANFRGKTREVTIVGEAFFDVAHDEKIPFIVHTASLSTHVLGTSFNVKAYPEDKNIKVDVLTGKVGVASPNSKTVFLTPNQEAVYNNSSKLINKLSGASVASISSWRDGSLVFKHVELGDVLSDLERKFSVKIKADQNISQCAITADFTSLPLKTILSILSKLVHGKTSLNNQIYYIKGKGC